MKKLIKQIVLMLLMASLVIVGSGCSKGKSSGGLLGKPTKKSSQEKTEEFTVEELKTEKGMERFEEYYEKYKNEWLLETSATAEEIAQSYIGYKEFSSGVKKIDDKYSDKGFVNPENVIDALTEVYEYAKELEENGEILSAEYNEEYMNVCILLSDGIKYMYVPEVEGLMSGGDDLDVLALNNGEYFEYDMFANIESLTLNHIDKAGKYIDNKLDVNSYEYEDNSTLGINQVKVLLKNLAPENRHVILWRGHGNVWDMEQYKNVSAQSTAITRQSVFWVSIDSDLISHMVYYDDLIAGNVVRAKDSGALAIAPGFFEKYMNSVKGGIFYTGACYSAADGGAMSNAILNKGFDCYFGSTDTISVGYSDLMMLSVIQNLCIYEDALKNKDMSSLAADTSVSSGKKTITAQKALDLARQDKGAVDMRGNFADVLLNLPNIFKTQLKNTQVVIKGNSSCRLVGSDDLDLGFADVQNVGNNPNNLWQSEDSPAFDDDYIYYALNENLYRVGYDGKNSEKIAGDVEGLLNVYDGFVYTYESGSAGNPFVKIKRINTETKAEEVILEKTGSKWREDYGVGALLVYDGYVFCLIYDEGNTNRTYIYAIDLTDMSNYLIHYESEARYAEFTVDTSGNLYAVIKANGSNANERKILRVNTASLRENAQSVSMEVLVDETNLGVYAAIMHGSGGLLRLASNPPSYREYYFSKIDVDKKEWFSSGGDYGEFNSKDKNADEYTIVTSRNQRYYIDGNVVIFVTDILYTDSDIIGDDQENVRVYMCENMNFKEPKEIGTVYGLNLFDNGSNIMGAHNGKVYVVEKKDTETNLVIIDQAGVINRVAIS